MGRRGWNPMTSMSSCKGIFSGVCSLLLEIASPRKSTKIFQKLPCYQRRERERWSSIHLRKESGGSDQSILARNITRFIRLEDDFRSEKKSPLMEKSRRILGLDTSQSENSFKKGKKIWFFENSEVAWDCSCFKVSFRQRMANSNINEINRSLVFSAFKKKKLKKKEEETRINKRREWTNEEDLIGKVAQNREPRILRWSKLWKGHRCSPEESRGKCWETGLSPRKLVAG